VFTTIEQVSYEKSWVVQYISSPDQAFMRDKLLISVNASLQHRPTALPDALELTATIIGKLGSVTQHGELTSTAIATMTFETLQRFDKVAATVYQAFHQDVL
jgi:transcriptional regulator NrdR family protein